MVTKRKLVVFGEQFWRPYIHVRDAARRSLGVLEAPEARVARRGVQRGRHRPELPEAAARRAHPSARADAVVEFVHKAGGPARLPRLVRQGRTSGSGSASRGRSRRASTRSPTSSRRTSSVTSTMRVPKLSAEASARSAGPGVHSALRAGDPRQRVEVRQGVPGHRLGLVGRALRRPLRAGGRRLRSGRRSPSRRSTGTAALHVALLVAGVEPDDEVLVSTLTFIAPANAIRYVGAWPVFIDAEPDVLADGSGAGRRSSSSGGACGARARSATARRAGASARCFRCTSSAIPSTWIPSLEAAPQVRAGRHRRRDREPGRALPGAARVGHLGDVACFSFNGNKLITTGGGGMIVTDDEALGAARAVPDDPGQGRPDRVRARRDRLTTTG